MLFKPEHIAAIRTGAKTATRRNWDENYGRPNPGAHMATTEMLVSHENCGCYIVVTDVYQQPLGEMTEEDAHKEGDYSLEEFREVWEKINGDGSWDPELVVDVVEFEYGGRSKEAAEEKAREMEVVDA